MLHKTSGSTVHTLPGLSVSLVVMVPQFKLLISFCVIEVVALGCMCSHYFVHLVSIQIQHIFKIIQEINIMTSTKEGGGVMIE